MTASHHDIKGLVLDVHGCLTRGRQAIPGLPETVQELNRRGLQLVYTSNDNQATAEQWIERLSDLGISAERREILTAATLAADYVREHYPGRRVLPIGHAGLLTTLQERGITLVRRAEDAEVVVMGRDPEFNQRSLTLAFQAIWRGAAFIATNLDRRVPASFVTEPADGKGPGVDAFLPCTGPMIQAVAWATGVDPIVAGKPSRWAAARAVATLGVAPRSASKSASIPRPSRSSTHASVAGRPPSGSAAPDPSLFVPAAPIR